MSLHIADRYRDCRTSGGFFICTSVDCPDCLRRDAVVAGHQQARAFRLDRIKRLNDCLGYDAAPRLAFHEDSADEAKWLSAMPVRKANRLRRLR